MIRHRHPSLWLLKAPSFRACLNSHVRGGARLLHGRLAGVPAAGELGGCGQRVHRSAESHSYQLPLLWGLVRDTRLIRVTPERARRNKIQSITELYWVIFSCCSIWLQSVVAGARSTQRSPPCNLFSYLHVRLGEWHFKGTLLPCFFLYSLYHLPPHHGHHGYCSRPSAATAAPAMISLADFWTRCQGNVVPRNSQSCKQTDSFPHGFTASQPWKAAV